MSRLSRRDVVTATGAAAAAALGSASPEAAAQPDAMADIAKRLGGQDMAAVAAYDQQLREGPPKRQSEGHEATV